MAERTESSLAPRPLTPDDPWQRWDPLRSVIGRLFSDVQEPWPRQLLEARPSVDITESDGEYHVRAELPGVSKQDVTVELEHGQLSIRGEKKSRRDEKSERGRRLECSFGTFSRTFTLPPDADAEHVSARFEDGVLDVTIRKDSDAKPKQIRIKG